jgi:hypothetical protein
LEVKSKDEELIQEWQCAVVEPDVAIEASHTD